MKKMVIALAVLSNLNVLASSGPGLICRDDRRMENGPLREVILTPADGGYLVQSQYIPSLHSPDIQIENWAEKLTCRIDEKLPVAFCQTQTKLGATQIKERREVFYDSLEENAKKKTNKYVDITVNENGVEKKAISFAASNCETFGGET